MSTRHATKYTVTDGRTGQVMGRYVTSRPAYRKADRLDAEYGAVRYVVAPPLSIPTTEGTTKP